MDKIKNLLVGTNDIGYNSKQVREIIFLAEQAVEGKIKVLPGKEWSLHYPVGDTERKEKLQGLLDGKYTTEEVVASISPDALFFNVEDVTLNGLEAVTSKVREISSYINNFDYVRFARFLDSMKERELTLAELEGLYSEVTRSRVQRKVLDSYGYTGRRQIEHSLRSEFDAEGNSHVFQSRSEKVLRALKASWLCDNLGIIGTEERDKIISELSGDERDVFRELEEFYKEYVESGNENAYAELIEKVQEDFPKIKQETTEGEVSESMQELEKELEEYKERTVPPGSPEDQAIPPEDSDEYHTPPPSSQSESKEKIRSRAIFEITPPLAGYYVSGKKSYFDRGTKTWSKRKKLDSYAKQDIQDERHTISGIIDGGIKSLPLPTGYALDASSLKTSGVSIEIKRDQNGCFYFEASGKGTFSIDFSKETSTFVTEPIKDDLDPLCDTLSTRTENVIGQLKGSPTQKAEQARQYIAANHFYPGGGDLEAAQALQYKLRSESSGENYILNLDTSEYLECYSGNTLFVSMVRKAGIPARLVIGHRVEGSQDGKSKITQSTGHAWSEIWDGKNWRRFDATPPPKPEDKKTEENTENTDEAEEAEDGGVDSGRQKNENPGDQSEETAKEGIKNPLDGMSESSDEDLESATEQLETAKKELQKMNEKEEEISKKLQETDKFKDLSDLKDEIESSELFDDMKEELNKKIEAKEEQMKEEVKNELDKMVEEGFMDEKRRDEIIDEIERKNLDELDHLRQEIERENDLYNQYEDIKKEVEPLVDKWFKYFVERLPRQQEIGIDDDSVMRQGQFDRRAVMKTRNLLFGTVKNPREFRSSVKPKFIASILVDVSGSMKGLKLLNARKLLVFYSELFNRISEVFGYINFSINIFSDSVTEIKGFKKDYSSPERYSYSDGSTSTVKVRLMERLNTEGGTNMLDGIVYAATELNELVNEYPEYASAFYFIGDGEDTCGNSAKITEFLSINESEKGFGEHMHSAIFLGDEPQRKVLANIFGDEHTTVAKNFDELIETSMDQFDQDISEYLRDKAY